MILQFNIAIIGEHGVGKTTYIERNKTGNFLQNPKIGPNNVCITYYKNPITYIPPEVLPNGTIIDTKTIINPNPNSINFVVYDGNIPDGVKLDGAIIMFNKVDKTSLEKVTDHYNKVKNNFSDNGQIILCGNKTDIPKMEVKYKDIYKTANNLNIKYIDVSSKSNYNLTKPFDYFYDLLTK